MEGKATCDVNTAEDFRCAYAGCKVTGRDLVNPSSGPRRNLNHDYRNYNL